ncbi:rhamnan synthesis protein F [Nitrosospira sp. Nsp2]|nr:rhamnan synthesis protein F [Nitrosospira sp. Nsp2]
MKVSPQPPAKLPSLWPPNWPIKWQLKAIFRDLQYLRDVAFHLLARNGTRAIPLVRFYGEGSISPDYNKPVCLFCSYDSEGVVRENVYQYLDELALAGFNIVFISSSDAIRDTDMEKLSRCCIRIMNRENKGYDFYGWKTGLEKYAEYRYHSGLLLANDSVLGPLFSIRDIIARFARCEADVVGMTESFHFHPHLQSYFIYCKKNVILSEEFVRFFREVDTLELKIAIIRKYEVGFSRLLGARFRLSALYGLETVLARFDYHQRPVRWIEPTFHLWKPLITELKFPFLKKSVLKRRGVSLEELGAVLAESGSSYDLAMLNDWIGPQDSVHPARENFSDVP